MTGERAPSLNIAPFYRVKWFESLDSTSQEAKRLARAGETPAGLWVLTDRQTAGRGRHGRTWVSEAGNVFASLLLFPAVDAGRNPELSFVAALAVAATLRHFGAGRITCKWPNDVLIGGKKAAGILLETESAGNPQRPWVVIGIGINVSSFPKETDFPGTCLNVHVPDPVSRDAVFETLTIKMSEAITRWAKDGFGPIRTLWLNQAHGRGQAIRIVSGEEVVEGVFEGLSKTGALLLKDFQGNLVEVISGTVLKEGA